MEPRIVEMPGKKLVGMRLRMSYADNKSGQLWGQFMPRRKEIKNTVGTDLISLQGTNKALKMNDISLDTEFEKWAAVEVAEFENIPLSMETFSLEAGKYAVFTHKGCSVESIVKTMQFILGEWLPNSGFELDNRPDFEVLGEKYARNHPDSEEEIWVPVRAG